MTWINTVFGSVIGCVTEAEDELQQIRAARAAVQQQFGKQQILNTGLRKQGQSDTHTIPKQEDQLQANTRTVRQQKGQLQQVCAQLAAVCKDLQQLRDQRHQPTGGASSVGFTILKKEFDQLGARHAGLQQEHALLQRSQQVRVVVLPAAPSTPVQAAPASAMADGAGAPWRKTRGGKQVRRMLRLREAQAAAQKPETKVAAPKPRKLVGPQLD